MPVSDPTVDLFETSPDGSLDAIVQRDERTMYLYLNGRDDKFGTRACWIRNLVAAPMDFSRSDLQQGIPPVLPRFVVHQPHGLAPPSPDDLRIVWFEEGNGIALFEKDALLAVIPPWSGQEGFHGYARDCTHENEVAWPMPPQPALRERIRRAEEFWSSWQTGNPFAALQSDLLAKYRERFGPEAQQFEVDRENWPPLSIYRFETAGQTVLATVGMCLRPQPNVELSQSHPALFRRIELALCDPPSQTLKESLELLAGQARYPWRKWTWLGHGHSAQLTRVGRPTLHLRFASEQADRGELTRFRDDPVNLIWISLDP